MRALTYDLVHLDHSNVHVTSLTPTLFFCSCALTMAIVFIDM